MSGPCTGWCPQLHLDMHLMESYENEIEDLRKELEKYKTIFRHSMAEKTGAYFICGEAGGADQKNSLGLPLFISVCPTYGADFRTTTYYKRCDTP